MCVCHQAGLQQRLADQEEAFLKMKAELLRVGFAQQSLRTEKVNISHEIKSNDLKMLNKSLHFAVISCCK